MAQKKKKKRPNTQNRTNNEQYWIDILPPELTGKNYPTLTTNSTKQNKNDKEKQP